MSCVVQNLILIKSQPGLSLFWFFRKIEQVYLSTGQCGPKKGGNL
jgi:hypothetical protein